MFLSQLWIYQANIFHFLFFTVALVLLNLCWVEFSCIFRSGASHSWSIKKKRVMKNSHLTLFLKTLYYLIKMSNIYFIYVYMLSINIYLSLCLYMPVCVCVCVQSVLNICRFFASELSNQIKCICCPQVHIRVL